MLGRHGAPGPRPAPVSFDAVELPESALRGGFPAGDTAAYMERNMSAGLFQAAASLGIAESAAATVERTLAARGAPDAAHPTSDGTGEQLTELFAAAQAAKTFVNEASGRIVDRALALSGGAGYLNGSPLARAYRDVRAGAFMHPLGANRAYTLLGDLALGRPALLH